VRFIFIFVCVLSVLFCCGCSSGVCGEVSVSDRDSWVDINGCRLQTALKGAVSNFACVPTSVPFVPLGLPSFVGVGSLYGLGCLFWLCGLG